MYLPDSIDDQLVRLLAEDARQSSESLAKQLNISAPSIRRRIRKLLSSKLLRIIGVVDATKFEPALSAVITLSVSLDKLESALDALIKRPEIRWVSNTTGRFDIIALARFHSTEDLTEFSAKVLGKIDGLKGSETFICLDMGVKNNYIPLAPIRTNK